MGCRTGNQNFQDVLRPPQLLLKIDDVNSNSDWLGTMGWHEFDDTDEFIPAALLRLRNLEKHNTTIDINTMLPSEMQQMDITKHHYVIDKVIVNNYIQHMAMNETLSFENSEDNDQPIKVISKHLEKIG